ncbi:MAG: amidohydrolase family protein [Acidimicrobiia bacterium]|nr:amidohydrolase family protein [Acidimicrobiia bacterium]
MRRLITADRVRTAGGIVGDAVLVDGGDVVEVGRRSDLVRPGIDETAYPGATIVPGLADAHFHPTGWATAVHRLTLHDARTLDEVVTAVREHSSTMPPGESLVATRLDDQRLAERRLPTRHDLDVIDRPVLLFRVCGHIAVANTAALEAAGVGPSTNDPVGGSLDRDEFGHPNGILRETAIGIVSATTGGRGDGLAPDKVVSALRALHDVGLTRIGAMVASGADPWCGGPSELRTLIEAAPDAPVEIDAFVIAEDPDGLTEAAERLATCGGPVRFAGVKMFSDGSFGGHTAALRNPYDDTGTTGTMRLPAAHRELARRALDLGGRVAIHAIGDFAVGTVLDVFTGLVDGGVDPSLLRVEHASLMDDADRVRFAEIGAIASMQPAFLPSDGPWLPTRLGDRIRDVFAHQSALDAGITVAGGSDCPVEQPSPLWGMAAARDRRGIVPEEEVSAGDALGLFTDGAAAALGEPPPLSGGSPAHLTILEDDPVTASPGDLPTLGVRAVWVRGHESEPVAS